jgi:hypothetical protein
VSHSYRIGPAAIAFPNCPPEALSQLIRTPIADFATSTLRLTAAGATQWPEELRQEPAEFRKGMPSHRTVIDYAASTLSIDYRLPIDTLASYLIYRDIFCCLCGLQGETLLHTSAVIIHDQAVAFCGLSGAGKTTIASLFRKRGTIINDEINWGYLQAGQPMLVNQAYYRDSAETQSAVPLAAIYLLQQAPDCAISAADAHRAYPLLLTAPFGGCDPNLPKRAAATAEFAQCVPIRTLAFNRDPDAVFATVSADLCGVGTCPSTG